jgi:hypothetical protein
MQTANVHRHVVKGASTFFLKDRSCFRGIASWKRERGKKQGERLDGGRCSECSAARLGRPTDAGAGREKRDGENSSPMRRRLLILDPLSRQQHSPQEFQISVCWSVA